MGEAPVDRSILASMLGDGVVVDIAAPTLVVSGLFPDELQHVARAVDKRKAEFGTARLCARRALAQLGVAPCSLVPNPDRSPRWPKGITGSITHTAGCCAVAVTDAPHVIGIGIDIEQDTPLRRDLESKICTATERAWLDHAEQRERGFLGKLYFSAKEAFYKCQYSTTRTFLDFNDVEIEFDMKRQSFRITRLKRQGPVWDIVCSAEGQFRQIAGFVITTAVLSLCGSWSRKTPCFPPDQHRAAGACSCHRNSNAQARGCLQPVTGGRTGSYPPAT
jgi:4'-phosphopantetheinyl transferase EntD